MKSTTTVTICGRSIYFTDMLKVASRYSNMGCIVLMRFELPVGVSKNTETLNETQLQKIKISDIVHIVHHEDLDDTTLNEISYARQLGKAITYIVPSEGYIGTFYFKEDNFIQGPLKWVRMATGMQLTDVHNKVIAVERESITS